jgi:O-antigen/teichoic acid export membrane protein
MTGVRRAFVLASVGRYLTMAINLAATPIMARLLAPADYGIAVLGGSVLAVVEAIRALGGGAYLVQEKDLTLAQIHTNFTISLIATAILTAALLLLIGPLTGFFGRPELEPYLRVAAFGFLAGLFSYPISALMSRGLAFGRIAFITTLTAAVNSGAGIALALLGWGYMSLAWAAALSSLAGMGFYLICWRDWSIFRLRLSEWRSVIGFSIHDSASGILSQFGEVVPYLIIGRTLDSYSVGLCQRAMLLALFPERVILAGVAAVALPAFAQEVREGQAPKVGYLKALSLISAAQWPSLVTLILLADPIVWIFLGAQWQGVVPVLRILAAALLFSFPVPLHYPMLVALGAVRVIPITTLAQAVVTICLLAAAAPFGLEAVALSSLIFIPFASLLSLVVVRHYLKFSWLELVAAIARSAAATLAGAVGPMAVIAAGGWQTDLSILPAAGAATLAGAGWIGGLWATRHPLLQEMLRVAERLSSRIAEKLSSTR